MIFDVLEPVPSSRDYIQSFGGYNRNERCEQNESFDETNISSDLFPNLSPRAKRTIFDTQADVKGLHVNNGLIMIKAAGDNDALFHDGVQKHTLAKLSDRMMCSMGAFVIIWPDKVKYNSSDGTLTDLCSSWTTEGSVSFQMCKIDGTTISPTVSSTAPSNPSSGDYWLDTSSTPNALKVWSADQSQWVAVATSYVKISATNIGKNFEKMDVVKISGVTGTYADTFNTDMCIWDKTDDSIVVTALISTTFTNTGLQVKKEPPEMDFICEHGNRIWGCSSANHEIYGSKLGDPSNWRSYLGLTTDSYAATVGTDGDFTGCAEQGGSVVFFKENYIHKLYGTYPSNYQINTSPEPGVQKGCEKSLQIIDGLLFYKAVNGVAYFEGSFPRYISDKLGDIRYNDASAGAYNGKYYIQMKPEGGTDYILFVYDSKRRMWHIEDKGKTFKHFVVHKNRLMFWDGTYILAEGSANVIDGTTYNLEASDVSWEWESGIIGLDSPDKKFIGQIMLRLAMELGATLNIDIMYDSSNEWEKAGSITNNYQKNRRHTQGYTELRTINLPIIPRRCDHLRIRFKGTGFIKIFSIAKTIESGGSQ